MSRLSPYLLWLILALPALGMAATLMQADGIAPLRGLLHPTGEFAARFMIISMMATPLMLLFPKWRMPRWLVRNRRYFGVAAFGYAALHTLFYVMAEPIADIVADAMDFEILTGWVAFAIFLPLAATSYDAAVRRMGRKWKVLQRFVYVAAVLTLLHWASLHDWNGTLPALVHFAPLAALSVYRIWWTFLRHRPGVQAA